MLDAILWVMDLLKLNPGIRRPSEMAVDKACLLGKDPARDGLGAAVHVGAIHH